MLKKIFFRTQIFLFLFSFIPNSYAFTYENWQIFINEAGGEDCVQNKVVHDNAFYLYAFLDKCSLVEYTDFKAWDRSEQQAFLINYYNACSYALFLKNPFSQNLQEYSVGPDAELFLIFGKKHSLNEIKHKYLRGMFDDERIHFALAPPAYVFPKLRKEVYLSDYLNLMLEEDVIRFLRDANYIQINSIRKVVKISPILKWFGNDFVKRYAGDEFSLSKFSLAEQSIIRFAASYLPEYREFLLSGDYDLVFMDADWKLRIK